jgi:hypothetical protein
LRCAPDVHQMVTPCNRLQRGQGCMATTEMPPHRLKRPGAGHPYRGGVTHGKYPSVPRRRRT